MNYGANVAFIDAHSVCARGGQYRIASFEELLLDRLLAFPGKAGVVEPNCTGGE